MKCEKCGYDIVGENTLCAQCEAKVKNEDEVEENFTMVEELNSPEDNLTDTTAVVHPKKKLILIGAVLTGIVIFWIIFATLFSASSKFLSALKKEEFDKAQSIYTESDDKTKEKLSAIINEYCEKLIVEYNAEEGEYTDIGLKIKSAETIVSSSEYTDDLTELNASKEAFTKGVEFEEKGDWSNAKVEFEKVIEEDKNYPNAVGKIQECDRAISLASFKLAQQYEGEEKWSDAIAEYDKVSEVTKEEYQKASERKLVCIEKLRASVNTQLDEMYVAGQYEEGLALIAIAEKYIQDDDALKSHKENFTVKKEEEDRIREQNKYNTGITYDQLARYPDEYKGEYVKFYGKVLQVQESSGIIAYRIGTSGYFSSNNVIYAIGYGVETNGRILEDDYVTVRGQSSGLYTYETVLGNELTIPSIIIDSIE